MGTIDIALGVLFWIAMVFSFSYFNPLILLLSLVLIVKGIVFLMGMDFASVVDVISGFLIVYALSYGLHTLIVVIISIFLIQKGVFSLWS
tara:strand:- start:946 stop:1215 length:270 start_codon:yes stop_codon:yes gene_type:complete